MVSTLFALYLCILVVYPFQGEELGLTDVFLTWQQTIDPAGCNTSPETYTDYSRDPTRTPFPWDNTANAGFSTNSSTWLPVAPNYATVNVMAQREAPFSHMKIFKTLTLLRHTLAMQEAGLVSRVIGTNILAYTRMLAGGETYAVVLNLGTTDQTVDLVSTFPGLSANVEVIVSSLQSKYISG